MNLPSYIVTTDTETAGLNPLENPILEVSFLSEFDYFTCAIKPSWGSIDPKAMEINKIDLDRPGFSELEACDLIDKWLACYKELHCPNNKIVIAGHNTGFDIGFLQQLYIHAGRPVPRLFNPHRILDTHSFLHRLHVKDPDRYPLSMTNSEGAFEFFKIPVEGRHTSLGDARAAHKLLQKLIEL